MRSLFIESHRSELINQVSDTHQRARERRHSPHVLQRSELSNFYDLLVLARRDRHVTMSWAHVGERHVGRAICVTRPRVNYAPTRPRG